MSPKSPQIWGFQCKQCDKELPDPETATGGAPRQFCSAKCKCAWHDAKRIGVKRERKDYHRIYQQQRRAAKAQAKKEV